MNRFIYSAELCALRLAGVVIFLVLACGCGSSRHTATHDTVYVDRVRVEKQRVLDSVYVDRWHNVWVSGDTVYRVDSVVKNRLLAVHDTLRLRDSVYVSRCDTVTVEVKKPLSGFEKVQVEGFWILLLCAAGAVAWKVLKFFRM